jgi:hypothetical protein
MARSGVLKASLDAHKGKNHALERQKKMRKKAEKRQKVGRAQELEDDEESEQEVVLTKKKGRTEVEVVDVEMGEDGEGDWVSEDDHVGFATPSVSAG